MKKTAKKVVKSPAKKAVKKSPVKKARALVNKAPKYISTKVGAVHFISNGIIGKHWHIKANNGEILAWCEPMHNNKDMLANLELTAKVATAAVRELKKMGVI